MSIIHENLVKQLKKLLAELGMGQRSFVEECLKKSYPSDDTPSENEIDKHYDRFKKRLKEPKRKNDTCDELRCYIAFATLLLNSNESAEKKACFEFTVELENRITCQPLPDGHGCEKAALSSIHQLFEIFKTTVKKYGPYCPTFNNTFSELMNEIIRPFTSYWHSKIDTNLNKTLFRGKLKELQKAIKSFLERPEVLKLQQ